MALIEIISFLIISSVLVGFGLNRLLRRRIDFRSSLFQSYLTGLIVIYTSVLAGLHLDLILNGLMYISIALLAYFLYYAYSIRNKIRFSPLQAGLLIVFTIVAVYFSIDVIKAIVYAPITAWDARSIWYLKAKQLFFANGLNTDTGINNYNNVNFAHPEYPFLVPMLGALIAKYMGYWNEFIPKSNLLLLWAGVLMAFYSMKHMHPVAKMLLFISFMLISPFYLYIGYMDAWLGIYAALSILFLIEYMRTFRSGYLLSGLTCMVFCNYIKQDAALITVSVLTAFFLMMVVTQHRRFIMLTIGRIVRMLVLILIVCIPFFLWMYYKNQHDLSASDFNFKLLTHFSEYSSTFSRAKLQAIYKNFILPVGYVKMMVIILVVGVSGIIYAKATKFAKPVIKMGIIKAAFPMMASLLFAAGMFVLYCLTINDVSWQLATSADRLRLDLVFFSLPALYGAGDLFFYSGFKRPRTFAKKKKATHPVNVKKKKYRKK